MPVPELSAVVLDFRPEDATLGSVMWSYAEAKENFVADTLSPFDEARKSVAVQGLRCGAPFGAVHRSKFLQLLCANGNPFQSADSDGKVDGFGVCFNITPPEDVPGATTRVPHPYNGDTTGPYFGPDNLHDFNHGADCRSEYGGLSSCPQLGGVSLNAHEQNRSKRRKPMAMVNTMGFDRFSFMVTLINEIENETINRRSSNAMVEHVSLHPADQSTCCKAGIWFTGRCWCRKPLLKSYDQFDRARLAFL